MNDRHGITAIAGGIALASLTFGGVASATTDPANGTAISKTQTIQLQGEDTYDSYDLTAQAGYGWDLRADWGIVNGDVSSESLWNGDIYDVDADGMCVEVRIDWHNDDLGYGDADYRAVCGDGDADEEWNKYPGDDGDYWEATSVEMTLYTVYPTAQRRELWNAR